VAGERGYLATRHDLDSVLHVLDLSDAASPVVVDRLRTVPLGEPSVVHALATDGERLYAADQEHGIVVFDLAGPGAPTELSVLELPGVTNMRLAGQRLEYTARSFTGVWFGIVDVDDLVEIAGFALAGSLDGAIAGGMLVAVGGRGLEVRAFDPADPWSSVEVYSHDDLFARRLAVDGNTAWIPAWDGLHVLDLSDPRNIVHTGPIALPTAGAEAMSVGDGLLTITTDRGVLMTLDVSQPTSPAPAATVEISVCTDCSALAVRDDGALFVADVAGGFRTSDLRDLSVGGRGSVDGALAFVDVAVGGDVAYVADWFHGLRVFDLGDPSGPEMVAATVTGGHPSSVLLDGTRLVLGESTNGGALHVLDVTDPLAPVWLGATATSFANGLALRDDLVFVAEGSLGAPGGMRIFDVANPAAIRLVGYYAGCDSARDVALAGDIALLACGSDGFHLVDVTRPEHPARAAVWLAEGTASAWSVAADGSRAYLGDDDAVTAIDITDPRAPTLIQRWPVAYTANALSVPFPGRVVAACGFAGLYQWELP
jgi:hypothetical protein